MCMFAHILRLGIKQLTSLRHDSVLLLFLFYAFTVAIYMPAGRSAGQCITPAWRLSTRTTVRSRGRWPRRCSHPSSRSPVLLAYDQLDGWSRQGQYTFVINVPANFQADPAGRSRARRR